MIFSRLQQQEHGKQILTWTENFNCDPNGHRQLANDDKVARAYTHGNRIFFVNIYKLQAWLLLLCAYK